jgi:hypothetical protein
MKTNITPLENPRAHRTGRRLGLTLALATLTLGQLTTPSLASAATVWTGPRITKSNADGPDQMTALVALMRGSSQGLYNSVQEAGFTHFLSPKDTEWADGTTANANLSYTDWDTWAKTIHGGPPSTVGVNAVLHLKTDDIYLDIKFLSWAVGGAYSYERSTPPAANLPPTVAIASPTNGAAFTSPANVPITANANDPDGSVTNVAFFDGGTFLGGPTTHPTPLRPA